MNRIHFILFFLCLLTFTQRGEVGAQENIYSLNLKFFYTTSSKIFLNPNSSDIVLRGQYLSIDNILGAGFEIRRKIGDTQFHIGLGSDYISKLVGYTNTKTQDGFWAVPVELTGYFYIPITDSDFKIFLGGGAGFYTGERIYYLSTTKAQTVKKNLGVGIHILGGVDYFIIKGLGIRSQLKFRDVQIKTKSKFSGENTNNLDSQINIDGMTVEVGVFYSF
jgi:hypothetical protein